MAEFKRAEPKPVPDDWQEEVKDYIAKREAYLESEEYSNLEDPRKPIQVTNTGYSWGPPVRLVNATPDELFAYFETYLSTKELTNALLTTWEHVEEDQLKKEWKSRFDAVTVRNEFVEWWLCKYTDYPVFVHQNMSRRMNSVIEQALVDHIKGGQ